VAVLASGTTISQVAPILFSPILSRIFNPEDFATLAIFLAVATFISNISMFRYEFAIVLPKTDREAVNIVALSLFLLGFTTVVAMGLLLLCRGYICKVFNEPRLYNWMLVIPLFVFIQGITRIINYWSTRKKKFKSVAIGNVIRNYSNSGISVLVGFEKLINSGGLIIGSLIGQLFETIYLLTRSGQVLKIAMKQFKAELFKLYAIRYKNFLLIDTPHIIIDNLNNQGSPFIIAYFFSKQTLGFYSFMMRILRLPVSLVGSAISQVFYRTIAESYMRGECIYASVKKIVVRMSVIGAIPALLLLFFARTFFSFVFGKEWAIAGEYASLLSLYMFSHFIVSCLSFVPYVVGRMKFDFIYSTICNFLFVSLIVLSAIFFDNFKMALVAISILISILYWIYIFWILKVSRR
jgi:lipopolysaccharide exporter